MRHQSAPAEPSPPVPQIQQGYFGAPYSPPCYPAPCSQPAPQHVAQPAMLYQQPVAIGIFRKDPTVQLLASFPIPGLGTILNGETGRGVGIACAYYLTCLIGLSLMFFVIGLFFVPVAIGIQIFAMMDAYKGAQKYNLMHGFTW